MCVGPDALPGEGRVSGLMFLGRCRWGPRGRSCGRMVIPGACSVCATPRICPAGLVRNQRSVLVALSLGRVSGHRAETILQLWVDADTQVRTCQFSFMERQEMPAHRGSSTPLWRAPARGVLACANVNEDKAPSCRTPVGCSSPPLEGCRLPATMRLHMTARTDLDLGGGSGSTVDLGWALSKPWPPTAEEEHEPMKRAERHIRRHQKDKY
jgi:hypothetical protein